MTLLSPAACSTACANCRFSATSIAATTMLPWQGLSLQFDPQSSRSRQRCLELSSPCASFETLVTLLGRDKTVSFIARETSLGWQSIYRIWDDRV
jgi:hypothetical protein